ncbi:hypothetical protein HON52_01855 [Candidatus Uhrbacteria bacterium]|jgi:hypothetical protein|nr:hypothetical protein [Candidatus Uhrbacteria bacterium]
MKNPESEKAGMCSHGNFSDSCVKCREVIIEKHDQLDNEGVYVIHGQESGAVAFGSIHTNNPESITIAKLKDSLNEYEQSVERAEISLMVEGMHGQEGQLDVEKLMEGVSTLGESVKRHGESGVLFWYAKQALDKGETVKITSPERPEDDIVTVLHKEGFAAEDIATYLSLRALTSSVGRGVKRDEPMALLKQKFAREAYHIDQLTGAGWIEDVRTEAELKEMVDKDPGALSAYVELVGAQFLSRLNARVMELGSKMGISTTVESLFSGDLQNVSIDDVNELSDPLDFSGRDTPVNKVSGRWNALRDEYLLSSIQESIAQGEKPFVVFGASHVIVLEDSLKGL